MALAAALALATVEQPLRVKRFKPLAKVVNIAEHGDELDHRDLHMVQADVSNPPPYADPYGIQHPSAYPEFRLKDITMQLVKKTKIFYIYLIATIAVVVGSIFLMYEKPTAQDIRIDTSDWKTWAWNAACGDFDIKYSPDWHVQLSYSGELGCNGTITHLPAEYRSLDKASEGIVIRFSYSKTSAVTETTAQNIEEKIIKFPERSFFPSILRCIKIKDIERDFVFIECYVNTDKGIYVIVSDIKSNYKNSYEYKVNKLLESFKLNN